MNLKQLLKSKGISNDIATSIAKAVEKRTEKMTEEEEIKARLQAQKMTLEIVREAFGNKQPPVAKKKTIIIPD
jgi:hypothetical protein